jgi:hypothetical protein
MFLAKANNFGPQLVATAIVKKKPVSANYLSFAD